MAGLLETLRSSISVSDGLKLAFEQFCRETRPERALIMSSGPLVIPQPTEAQLHILHAWPSHQPGRDPRSREERTATTLCLRAIAEIRHQGEIGLIIYFRRSFPKRAAAACRRVLETLVQTAAAMIEVDHRYRALLRALPFDPLTHLPVWSLFREKVDRRFARLDHEQLPATLMLVCFSGLLHTTSDIVEAEEAVEQIAHVRDAISFLQRAIRPTDLIGQLDRESYVLWLDGGDRFASVERAEQICRRKYLCSAGANPLVSVKIGLVTREPGSTDSLDVFFERARLALSIAQEENVDWYFAHESA
ncbi:hypothetical protein AA0535_2667 [Asaia krungthepensis NRIC 0535]|uniref:GGDEF domain-containing protein n=2 Tax=Asaia krungthepensis TaxID=220990 RepID=A0ABQ0Q5Y8_9PROT|nr:hypothetical protein AA0535_2667 [Asaia krungthepensis NRIC 0535]